MFRPKYGFETPTQTWLHGPLQPFIQLLREPRTAARSIFQTDVLQTLDLDRDWELLWTAACLETLLRLFVDGEESVTFVNETLD